MSLIYADRIKETTSTSGTGTVTLAGAVSGYQSFAQVGDGNKCYYRLENGSAWEIGIGTYTSSGTTLSRDTILASSNSGSAISLSGSSYVYLDVPSNFYGQSIPVIKARVATTANVDLSTAVDNGKTLNGVTLATGDVIFAWQQSTGSQNGAYVVAASGAATRHPLMPAGRKGDGLLVQVTAGTLYKDQLFACTSNGTVIGTDATTWGAPVNNMIGDSGSGGTRGLVPAPSPGDYAAGKCLTAGGTWEVPSGSSAVAGSLPLNLIYNGGFSVGQRADFSSLVSKNNNTYGLDRWKVLSQGSTAGVQQITGVATNSVHGMYIQNNTGSNNRVGVLQVLEAKDCIPLRGKTVTFKIGGLTCEQTKNMRLAALEWTGTADAPTTDVVNSWTNTTFTAGNFFKSTTTNVLGTQQVACTATVQTSGTLTVTVGNSCNNLILFVFMEDVLTTANGFKLEQAQLSYGASAGVWIPRPFMMEEAICQRYCYAATGSRFIGICNGSADIVGIYNRTPVPMRTTPTMSVLNASSWNAGSPGSTQVAAYNIGWGSGYATITGALTVSVYSYDRSTFIPWFTAGSSFGGPSSGYELQMLFGSTVRIIADADL